VEGGCIPYIILVQVLIEVKFSYFFFPLRSIREEVIILVVFSGRGSLTKTHLSLKYSLMYIKVDQGI
jgi:hypothetical protein